MEDYVHVIKWQNVTVGMFQEKVNTKYQVNVSPVDFLEMVISSTWMLQLQTEVEKGYEWRTHSDHLLNLDLDLWKQIQISVV